MQGKQKAQRIYENWVLGKHIDGKKIVKVELIGPPSFVVGLVTVFTEDGESYYLPEFTGDFRPRKKNLWMLIDEYKAEVTKNG